MTRATGTEHDPFDEASIPTLLMCLAQITGEDHWLQEPYLPRRDTNLFHDETGGLPSAVQDEVRNAARQVLQDIANNSRSIRP